MNRKNLEAVYELTPMQQGMLFHSRYGGDAGVYLTQFHCDLHGDLEAGAFRQAWQTALDRHPVLRSSFHWQTKLDKPLQIVHRQLELPLESLDWRHLGAAEQEAQAADLLANDRERGFDLERAPLLRIVLLRLGERDYRLFWNHHHLLLDGWSVGLVLQEVFALYQAKVRGHALELPRPRPYKDFILWLKKQDRSAAEAYWRQLLAGFREPTVIELEPVGCPPESEYDRVFRDFKAPATATLEAAGRRERVTLNTLFQGAWALLLSRYAGRRDVVFGATTAGRPADLPGVEGMIGLFINTLPVRVALTEEPVADELRQLQAQQGQSRRYEWAPLADIRQWSDVAAGTPLFNSLVVFENLPLERKQDDATALAVGSAGFVQRTNYPLTLAISPRGKELSVRLAYATEHFDRTTIHRLLSELETLLLRFAATPTAPIDRLEVLTASERHQLLTEWNDSHREPLGDSTIHQLIAAQATRTPEAPAVRIGDREVSYRELVGRARHLGQHLRGAGVEPEQIVAVCAESSLGALVALLAVLEAGGAYLPLDPAYPQERLDFMLADSGARLVLTHGDLSQRFRPSGVRTVTLDDTEAALTAGAPVEDRATSAATRPDHPVYLIYTSGSTGRPKGVMVEHRTLVARVRAMVELFELRPGHRQLQFVSLSFDVAGEEIFAPLACGATVVLSPEIRSLSPADMLAECGRLGVTKLNVPASHWHQMVDELEARDHRVPECLEILVTGAESPSPEKLSRWRRRASPASRLYNVYGPTEATILCSAQRFEMHSREPVGHRLPIGRRLANATLHVLDPTLWPVPVGTLGELGIGGYGLARGYHGRSAATAERFVPDPLSDTAGQRLYRTGDLVRHLPDGRLEFGGRVDHQVKLRGFRIELGEIEEALRRHPRIDDTAVLLREDRPGEQRLVAYIVVAGADEQRGNASAPLALSALRSHLAQHLPEFMVPAAFVFLDALPLTRNDKVDRRALPPPGSDRPDLETPYVPPSHAMERYLAEVWQDILGVERIGLHDGFFELGGDSLKGARFINRLEAELGEYVYVVALFDSPTVAGFGRYLSQHCPAAVEKRFGADSLTLTDEPQATADTASERIGEGDLRRVLELIEPLEPFTAEPSEPNPPAVFVLSPPRSGSTLLRVMLAGHPDLFAPPELDILSFNTLAERRDAFSGRYSFWLEGLLRAVMEIDDCDAEAARGTVEACEASGMSSKAFYRTLQERLEGRLLIDKTPAYALDLEVLRRAERDFEQTRFIHLLRHPCGMVNSFEKARIDELFFRYEHPYTPPQLGELMWNVCHRNILQFLQEIPPERQHRVRFEELVTHPDAVISGLCDFLGVEMQPRMLEPYSDPENRMTDGIHPLAKMLGDVKFHQHRAIDPRVAWRWQEIYDEDFLSESLSWPLAADLGYEKPELWQQAEPLPAPEPRRELTALETLPRNADGGGRFALSFGQQRLWVLDRLAPVGAGYNLPAAVKIRGRLVVAALAGSFADLVERHETLRCRFAAIDGTPPPDDAPTPPDEPGPHDAVQQIVEPPRLPDLALIDLTALSSEDRRAQTHRLAAAEARQPFDLARGPLLRIRLLAESADRHTLLVNLHHIVSDGWSQGVLLRELTSFYRSRIERRPPTLSPLALQYADYAAWQQHWLAGEPLQRELEVWRERLVGAPELLELPTDRPRPAIQSFRGARYRRVFAAGLSETLRTVGRRHEATLFMTLGAAFGALLSRVSGQADLTIGTPVAGRDRRELEALIGFFVNTLVLRLDHTGNPTFLELLERARSRTLEALQHQSLPFEKLVEELQPQRSTSHQPLFQVAYVLQGTAERVLELPGLRFEPLEVETVSSKFDLTLSLNETPTGLLGSLEYSSDLFDLTTVARLAEHLDVLLAGIAEAPSTTLWQLPLQSPAQRHQIVAEWPSEGRAVVPGLPIHERFRARAAERPDTIALVGDTSSETAAEAPEPAFVSYGELDRRSNRLAHHLQSLGVGPEVRVGLFMQRSIDAVVGILGTLEAGGAYLPIDPAYPGERIRFMLADAGVDVLLSEANLAATLGRDRPWHLVDLDRDAEAIHQHSSAPPAVRARPDHLAYVIYTSGSTGKPKGTLVTHGHLGRLLDATEPWFHFDPSDVWTLFHSLAFDFSVWELWGALAYGGRLVVVPWQLSRSPAAFAELLERQRVTVLNQTPSAFQQLVAQDNQRGTLRAPLDWVIFGGEALDVASLAPWWQHHGDQRPRLVNMYGITETTVHVTHRPLNATDLTTGWRRVIGRGIPDLELHVLDPQGQPTPMGVPGEIHVGGAGVSRGYLGRPGLTAARFLPDPFSEQDDARLYRTGDKARWLPGGELEYLGRLDHQVKVRGFRIELGEIEAALRDHPAVRRAVVLPRDYAAADRRLVAWIVPDSQRAAPLVRWLAMRDPAEGNDLYELENGLAVAHLNRSETAFLDREIFADASYLRHGIEVGEGDCVFDVGANIGLFSLQAAQRGARVFAFEPIPQVYDILRRNHELYGIAGGAFDCGLAAEPGSARFTYYPQVSLISGRFGAATQERDVVRAFLQQQEDGVDSGGLEELLDERLRTEEVDCRLSTVSEVLRAEALDRIDLLKVDVEKSELEVLRGVAEDDWPKIRQVVVEVHDIDGRLATVQALLRRHGFEPVVEQDPQLRDTGLYSLYAVHPERRRQAASGSAGTVNQDFGWSSPRRLEESLRDAARQQLPEYMTPAAWVMLPELPLTANGKLDRSALPAPGEAASGQRRDESFTPPRNELEESLAGLFEELLQSEPVSVHRDFFELGGHSLLAVRLMAEIRSRFGLDLPLAALFQGGTVEKLAQRIRQGQDSVEPQVASSPLVEIQRGDPDRPVLFCIHPAGGNVLCYAELARALGPEQPVFGLRARGLAADEAPHRRITDMAADYLEAIRSFQPRGPFALLGWSLGGLVAQEIACRLAAEDQPVALLAVLDVWARVPETARFANDAEMLSAALEGAVRLTPEELEDVASDQHLELLITKARAADALPDDFGVADARRYLRLFEAGREATATHEPQAYPGSMSLFRATEEPPEASRDPALGWRRYIEGELEVHRVPGSHQTMLAPSNVQMLADQLRTLLS